MRSATYHRVSTLDQDASTARDALRQAVQRRGHELTLEIEETGSGARNDRPGYQRLLKACQRREIDTLYLWKLDRLGRSTLDVLSTVDRLSQWGVTLEVIDQGLTIKPNGDSISKLILTVMAAVAEFERDLIRDRTRLGLARAKKHGTKSGKAIGRPSQAPKPDENQVRKLKEEGRSLRFIASALGTTVSAVRMVK